MSSAGRRRAPVHRRAVGRRRWPPPTGARRARTMTAARRRIGGRAVPALRAGHRADRHGDDPDRRRARRARQRRCTSSRRCRGTAPRDRAGLGRRLVRARRPRGVRSPRSTRSRGRQDATCSGGRSGSSAYSLLAGRRRPARRRLVPAVDAVIAMSPPLTLGLTGSGRAGSGAAAWCSTSRTSSPTPRSRPGRSPTAGDPRRAGSNGSATGPPMRSPCCPTTCATTSRPSSRRDGRQGARHPQLRRHRGDRPGDR